MHGIRARPYIFDRHIADVIDDIGVIPQPAEHPVCAIPAVQDVIGRATGERIGTGQTVYNVRRKSAGEDIVAIRAVEQTIVRNYFDGEGVFCIKIVFVGRYDRNGIGARGCWSSFECQLWDRTAAIWQELAIGGANKVAKRVIRVCIRERTLKLQTNRKYRVVT